ncbi:MAG: Hsp70 family protein, partial [Ignavibacteriae bacterium]|nr:Hsp70 family protein [Ignavibacteriota bacterium]
MGTTNSAICRLKDGNIFIFKSDRYQKDTTPSCVHFSPKKQIFVGDRVYLPIPLLTDPTNTYTEFKRNMGKDYMYFSNNMNEHYSPEMLSAEILKTLKNYVKDEEFNAVVITVPAKFYGVQYDATKRSAEMAGFQYCELLQEPIAASLAYAVDYKTKDGYWLVFDFGGGTFDAALMSSNEGIMKVEDTEGDNHLGGKNLDLAIVDEILLPYISDRYSVSKTLSDNSKYAFLRNYLKFYAEFNKIDLSTANTTEFNTEGPI